jgi:CelD/BcsL family acetyltransferase involved in cellulose biosynthesis
MTLPESMDAFYGSQSKATRKTLRRALRHVEKEYPGQVEHAHYQRPREVDEAVAAMRQVSLKTYQFGMGAGFAGDQSERERLVEAAGKGWLRAHVLRLAGRPVAFELALQYGGTYFLCSSGYDPDMGEVSPGKVLFLLLLEELCRSRPVERLDFGFGDAEYKRTYCDVHWMEADVYVFGARPKLALINLLRTALIVVSLAARWIVDRLGVLRRVKREWRDRFQSGAARTPAEEEDTEEK